MHNPPELPSVGDRRRDADPRNLDLRSARVAVPEKPSAFSPLERKGDRGAVAAEDEVGEVDVYLVFD